jgi:hypothetical protein
MDHSWMGDLSVDGKSRCRTSGVLGQGHLSGNRVNQDLTAVSRNFRKDGQTWEQIFTLELERISS